MHAGHGAAGASCILSFPEVGHAMPPTSDRPVIKAWFGQVRAARRARVSEASEPASRWGLIGLWPQALSRRRWLVGLGGARARAAVRADLQPDLARCVDVARVRVCFCNRASRPEKLYVVREGLHTTLSQLSVPTQNDCIGP